PLVSTYNAETSSQVLACMSNMQTFLAVRCHEIAFTKVCSVDIAYVLFLFIHIKAAPRNPRPGLHYKFLLA
ncbi:hypothetical protein P4764_15080, partial [Listeria monocytogenes]|nr:hypothetical protein [Listeria monocytogenes]